MAIYVNTNVGGIRGRNQLNNVNNQLNTTYQRLSSGLRINSAKDDAAGLAISDRMTSQINGLNQGNRNAADAIALMQTIEGGFDEATSSLQQIRTLMVQAANGTNTSDDRKALGAQMKSLAQGIDSIATTTKYGGKTILNGFNTDAQSAVTSIFAADTAGSTGASQTGADGIISFQIGANGGDTMSLTVKSLNTATTGSLTKTLDITSSTATEAGCVIKNLAANGADTDANIKSAIEGIDAIIKAVDGERANLGAYQNRLDSTMRNQSNVIANQSDARSRIRDTDFAEESAKLSQQNIIQQASMSMLMQANARPQMALSLLG